MKKLMIISFIVTVATTARAHSDCVTKLASKPYCITIATAELNCEELGNQADLVTSCMDERGLGASICLVGTVETSDSEKNKSLCE